MFKFVLGQGYRYDKTHCKETGLALVTQKSLDGSTAREHQPGSPLICACASTDPPVLLDYLPVPQENRALGLISRGMQGLGTRCT